MAARRRVKVIGPPVRGLTDFPEHSRPENSTQALNVEFYKGGVTTRGGTRQIVNNVYTQGGSAREVAVKLVRRWRGGTFTDRTIVGYVPLAGADANTERLDSRILSQGAVAPISHSFSVALPRPVVPLVNTGRRSRWDGTMFTPYGHPDPGFVICTDNNHDSASSVFRTTLNGFDMTAVTGRDRAAQPFHGGIIHNSPWTDDPTNAGYSTEPMRARYCRPHKGRLVLGHIRDMKANGIPNNDKAAIWYSNLADGLGWPLDNIILPNAGDQTEVTGLAEWQNHIVVFRRGSISLFKLTGVGPTQTPQYWQVVRGRGCIAHDTILDDIQGMTMFLAADGFYGFNGSGSLVYLSRPIERTLRAAIQDSGEGLEASHSVHFQRNRQVWLTVPSWEDGADRVFVMDYSYSPPVWSIFEFRTAAGVAGRVRRQGGFVTNSEGQRLYGITYETNGTIDYHEFNQPISTDDQNAAVEIGFISRWESGPVEFGNAHVNRWRYIRPTIRPQGNYTHTFWWRRDGQSFNGGGNHNGQSVDASMAAQGGGNTLGAFVLGTDRIGAAEDHQIRLDVHVGGIGRYGRIGIETVGSTANRAFDIRGLEIDVMDRMVRR